MDPSEPQGDAPDAPGEVSDYAAQAVAYVHKALSVELGYDSETLSVLDHYLKVGQIQGEAATHLVAATCGAYFGEVVRRRLGGAWDLVSPDPGTWRLVLASGLWISPAAMALAAIRGPLEDADAEESTNPDAGLPEWGGAELHAPSDLQQRVEDILSGMAQVAEHDFYTLCCRLDALEHVEEILIAERSQAKDPDAAAN